MEKVSVIMPVYNKERYLREAIESVLNQTYPEFELLLIDDGSTDGSKEICEEYSKKDRRILLLENTTQIHGPGPARNIGLDHATGDYLCFLDSDDWIDERLLECAVGRMQETRADMVQFGVRYACEDETNAIQYTPKCKRVINKQDMKRVFFNLWKEIYSAMWMYLYRHETVKTIRFESIVNGEDQCYIGDALANAETISFTDEIFYHYRYVTDSISRQWNKNMINCRGNIWEHQRRFLDSLPGQVDPCFYVVVAYENITWALSKFCTNHCSLSYQEKKKELLELENRIAFDTYRGFYPLKLQHGLLRVEYMLVKYHLEGLVLLFGPTWCRIKEVVQFVARKNRKVEL